jgi:hypothetical protein
MLGAFKPASSNSLIFTMFLATLLESEYVSSSSEELSRVSDGNKGVIGELKKFNN